MTTNCRKCGANLEQPGVKFCPSCGSPVSVAFPIQHKDAVDEFAHHESVLQNYRSMFLVSETFTVSIAATRLDDRGLVLLFAAVGISLLAIWIVITMLRVRVVEFFEENDEEGALMRYHHSVEGVAHRAGFRFFTVALPSMFVVFWFILILLAYGVVG
jgi:hypothetical protein